MLKEMFSKTEIQVAIIAAIATIITVIGSIYISNKTNNTQVELQRIEAVREMKRTYYNDLTEAFTKKLMYTNMPDSIEKVEAEMKFLEEASRLPLYASQEMVEFIETMKDPKTAKDTKLKEYYIIMRRDLCSNEFNEFNELADLSITVPQRVVVTDSLGNKYIQGCENEGSQIKN